MVKIVYLYIPFFLILFSMDESVSAESVDDIQNKLVFVQSKIKNFEDELQPLLKKRKQVSLTQDKTERELRQLQRNEKKLTTQLENLSLERETLTSKLEELQAQLDIRRTFLDKRIAYMYKTRRRLAPISLLVSSDSVANLYKMFSNLKYLVKNDIHQIEDFVQLSKEYKNSNDRLGAVQNESQINLHKARENAALIREKKLEVAKINRELKQQIQDIKLRLASLRSEQQEYEELIRDLLSGIEEEEKVAEDEVKPSITGRQIFRPRSLVAPVPGTVVQHFGKQKHSQFSDSIFVKGIEVSTAANSEVQAVGPGKVVFDAVLPGFGNVVILDHGDAYFSLYGRILPKKAKGDFVTQGEVIGTTSVADDLGRNFYFEVRKDRKPVDPEKFFVKDAY